MIYTWYIDTLDWPSFCILLDVQSGRVQPMDMTHYWENENDIFSVSDTGILGKNIRVVPTGVEPMTFRFTTPDALPLSYRRLVGA